MKRTSSHLTLLSLITGAVSLMLNPFKLAFKTRTFLTSAINNFDPATNDFITETKYVQPLFKGPGDGDDGGVVRVLVKLGN